MVKQVASTVLVVIGYLTTLQSADLPTRARLLRIDVETNGSSPARLHELVTQVRALNRLLTTERLTANPDRVQNQRLATYLRANGTEKTLESLASTLDRQADTERINFKVTTVGQEVYCQDSIWKSSQDDCTTSSGGGQSGNWGICESLRMLEDVLHALELFVCTDIFGGEAACAAVSAQLLAVWTLLTMRGC